MADGQIDADYEMPGGPERITKDERPFGVYDFSDCDWGAFKLTFVGSRNVMRCLPGLNPPSCSRLSSTRSRVMLTIWGDKQRYCDGINRRNFLQIGAFGAGLTLADVLRARAQGPAVALKRTTQKAAIMVYLPGGPPHMDMYDLKPDDPKEFRGEFNPIRTSVPGIQICEHMPLQARMFDKLAVIRSLISIEEHSDSLVMTGYSENINRTAQHPCFGSVVSRMRSGSGNDVPPFVSLRGYGPPGTEPGYLGVGHRPFSPSGPGVENLRLANGINAERMDDRKSLLGQFDTIRREVDASGTMKGMDSFTGRAFDMIASGVVRK